MNKTVTIRPGKVVLIILSGCWLAVSCLLPALIMLKLSIAEADSNDPLGTLVTFTNKIFTLRINLNNYLFLVQDNLYLLTYLSSIRYAALTTLFCLIIGYPFAYFMTRVPLRYRNTLLVLVMLPFWTSFLLRIYAWKGLLSNHGVINQLLLAAGWIDQPLAIMNTPFAMLTGMVYSYLPFMILPLFNNLAKMDQRLLEAAADLGASHWATFWRVTVPLSRSGIMAGAMLVFIPCVGEFVIPDLLGGPATPMIGHVIWDEFFSSNDWPMASAITVVMIILILVPIGILERKQTGPVRENR